MLSTINAFPVSHSQDDDIPTVKVKNNSEVSNSEAICAKLRICKIDQPVSHSPKRSLCVLIFRQQNGVRSCFLICQVLQPRLKD